MTAIGFVGFGEVASHFAARLRECGAQVSAYDVLLEQSDGAATLAARAHGEPPAFVSLTKLIAGADILMSSVTTDVALKAAQDCAPHLRPCHVYIDLNATAPAMKREIATVVAASGAQFVEGAILPAVGVMGAKAQVLLCGPEAPKMAARMSQLGLNFAAYGEEIGKASSFKMLRSIFSKGFEAVLLECMLAGRRAGVEKDLWREIVATLDAATFEHVGGNWVCTHATAHDRRYHEMVQVESLLRELDIDPLMTAATVKLFRRSAGVALKDAFPKPAGSVAQVIAALDTRISAAAKSQS